MKSAAEPRVRTMTIVGALSVILGLGGMNMTTTAWAQDGQPPASDQAKGEAALVAGRQALNQGRWQEAANQFSIALQYMPDNAEAMAGLNVARTHLNEGETSPSVAQVRQIQHDRAISEFDDSYRQAQERLKQGDFAGASQEITLALVKLDQRQEFLTPAEYTGMKDRGTKLQSDVDSAREADQLKRENDARTAALEQQNLQKQREAEERQRKIDELLRRVRQLQMELKYKEALQAIDEVLFLDDLNPAALVLRDVITAAQIYREYADIVQAKELGFSTQSVEAQRSMILPRKNFTGPGNLSTNGLMDYPEDWPQLSIRRTDSGGSFSDSAPDRMVRQRMDDTHIPVDFNQVSLEQVVRYVESVTGMNIYVDYKALSNAGIDKDAPISLRLHDVSVKSALQRSLEQLGDGDQRPQMEVADGILTISSEAAIRRRTVPVVYDIRDLLHQVPVFDNAPTLDLDAALDQNNGQGAGGGGSGGGASKGGRIFSDPGAENPRLTRAELVQQIVDLIETTVDPNGWRDMGGDTGTIQELNGNLIINNTPANHRDIEGLLSQLREIRALQINVESRFLTVSTDWFERISVDLDLYFNTNNNMFDAARAVDPNFHLSDFFTNRGALKDPVVFGAPNQIPPAIPTPPPGSINTVPTGDLFGVPNAAGTGIDYLIGPVGTPIRNQQGFSPIPVVQNHNNLIRDLAEFSATSFAGVALANPALAVGIQFIDDVQVDLLIEATQADRRAVTLTAPRLTFFNGQRAWVAVTTQTAYVASLTAVTGDASGAFQPNIATLSDGFVLDVEGVISADRRYVTLTVIFDFAEFLGFRQSSAAEFGGAAGGGNTGGGVGGNASQFQGSVELPVLRVSQIRTTVSVPDKGTALLGGQRHVKETEVEAGVPVLSKIPWINRFFTNRVSSKEEQTLLILIRPEIIIQQENEDLLFPGLSDSLGGGRAYLR